MERVQTYAAQFDDTDYEVNTKFLCYRWSKGLGCDYQSINNMFDETVIIPDGWSEKFPLQKLVDKAESYLRSRGVKDANDKKKYEKKQDRRKTFQNDKYKDTDLQGRVRNKLPQDGPPQLMQQQPKAATPTKSTEDSA